MSDEATFKFDGWGVVEFMGHRKRAGKVRTAEIGGTAVFIVETPAADQDGRFVAEIYAASALYCLTPCSEEVARISAAHVNPAPIGRYDLPAPMRRALEELEGRSTTSLRVVDESDEAPF